MISDLVSNVVGYITPTSSHSPKATSVTELRFLTFFRGPSKTFSNRRVLLDKIIWVASVVFASIIKFGLFLCNPGLTVLGFVGGVVLKGTSRSMDRIKLVWHNSSWPRCFLYIVGGFFALPTVVAVTSFLWAAELGSQDYASARARG